MPRLLIVILLWAAIYLPALGTLEIKGEEGRRILPAITMLETGNFIVPYVGSDPYYTKPPLINWLVAASFKIFGARNEWTARLPSALSVLAVALVFLFVARRALGENGSFIAALIWLTNFGMVEKGRLIEIEAVYVSLAGIAFICWLSWWQEKRSPWLTWTVPWIFLGLALLAKGPVHLLFFYAVVLGVVWGRPALGPKVHAAHLTGVLLMLAIFAAWAIPCLRMMPADEVARVWSEQFTGRLSGEDFKFAGWIMNIPRGLAYFLPWMLLFPLLGRGNAEGRMGIALGASFLFVALLPGSLARYTMPLLVPATWLLATLLAREDMVLPRWLRLQRPPAWPQPLRLPGLMATAVCGAMLIYSLGLTPFLRQREKVRNIAREIDEAVSRGATLHVVDPDYQPWLFYLRGPLVYVPEVDAVPRDARYVLVQSAREKEALESTRWAPRRARVLRRWRDYRRKEVTLLELVGGADLTSR